jgi:hypothetical protein
MLEEVQKLPEEKLDEPPRCHGRRHDVARRRVAYDGLSLVHSRTAQINYIQTLYGDFERH